MRYRKGSIETSLQDRRLLDQVLRSQFVAHSQLWQLLRGERVEMSRQSYCWRVRRLVEHGFLARHEAPAVTNEAIYSLAPRGVQVLQSGATFYADNPSSVSRGNPEPHVAHAVMLNTIHLRLLRVGLLAEWVWEREIWARNEFTPDGYRKDYDAIVSIYCECGRVRFGLEYERWAKGARHYAEIVARLQKESKLERFLYLVSGEQLRRFLMQCFHRKCGKPIYIGLAEELLSEDPSTIGLIEATNLSVTTLGKVL